MIPKGIFALVFLSLCLLVLINKSQAEKCFKANRIHEVIIITTLIHLLFFFNLFILIWKSQMNLKIFRSREQFYIKNGMICLNLSSKSVDDAGKRASISQKRLAMSNRPSIPWRIGGSLNSYHVVRKTYQPESSIEKLIFSIYNFIFGKK